MKTERKGISPMLLTVAQAANALGLSRWTIIKWIADGRIGSVKLGKRRMLEVSAIQALIEKSRISAKTEFVVGEQAVQIEAGRIPNFRARDVPL
mgnify:CR=1 FL=1